MKFFGREPALWIAFAGAAIQVFSSLVFNLTVDQQGTLNFIVVAVFGLATAFVVKGDQMVPAILGFFKGLTALAIAFGLNFSPENQALVMVLIGTVVAIVVRDRVVAPVAPTAPVAADPVVVVDAAQVDPT